MPDSNVYNNSSNEEDADKESLLHLAKKAKNGDAGAFTELYNLFFKKIYRFTYYRVNHKETAEDLTEDIFVKAYGKISSINPDSGFAGWLYQIAKNTIIDYYRAKKIVIDISGFENTLEYDQNLFEELQFSQDQKYLLSLVKKLPPDQQTVIKLKFFEELENPEIADILKKTEAAIRVIQHRAITQLKNLNTKQN